MNKLFSKVSFSNSLTVISLPDSVGGFVPKTFFLLVKNFIFLSLFLLSRSVIWAIILVLVNVEILHRYGFCYIVQFFVILSCHFTKLEVVCSSLTPAGFRRATIFFFTDLRNTVVYYQHFIYFIYMWILLSQCVTFRWTSLSDKAI